MPSLDELDLPASPLADPQSYPGVALDADYLWLDTWLYEISPTSDRCLSPRSGPGRWLVGIDGGPLATGISVGQPTEASLDEALARTGAAPMTSRYPVVSFGSNAAPAQLRDKYAELDPSSKTVPVTRGSISGLALSHSAHVSDPGYLPYVLVDNGSDSGFGGGALPVFVLWLDAGQLRVMDRSEPNYDLVPVPSDRYPLTLRGGFVVDVYSAYKGKWGALRTGGFTGPSPVGTQANIYAALNRWEWFRGLVGPGDVRAQLAALRGDAGLREQVRVELAARGLVATDGWRADGSTPRP